MNIEQLTSLQQQFTKHLQTIRNESKNLPKCQTLRIGAWLKKLCSVVDNYFWRKNRNLYAEVLALMLLQGTLEAPFDRSPPQGSLVKLTPYEIPYSIRQKLESKKAKIQQKENNLQLSNIMMSRINSTQISNLRSKKRQSLALKSFKQISSNENQYQFEEEEKQHQPTERKVPKIDKKKQSLLNTIEYMLHFLAKNNSKFIQDQQYFQLIQDIVSFGDETGRNFANLKFTTQ